jgi:hypothetical protein
MDVPEIVFVAELLPIHAEVMLEPGALRSTQVPKFEYEASESALVVAPTVTASAVRAGEDLHALWLLLPAATA